MPYLNGNIYVITTIAVIGGALFGFDIASMSAMYVPSTYPRLLHDAVSNSSISASARNNTNASSTKAASTPTANAPAQHPAHKAGSPRPCRGVRSSARCHPE
jgi:hypothetical protein